MENTYNTEVDQGFTIGDFQHEIDYLSRVL